MTVGHIARQFAPYLFALRGRFALGIGLILLATAAELALPLLIGRIVDAVAGQGGWQPLAWAAAAYGVMVFVKALLEALEAYVIQATGQAATHALRGELFARILRLPVAYFDTHPTGRLVTRVINDIKSVSELFTASISVLALDVVIILGTVAAMFWLDSRLAAVVLLVFPLAVFTIHFFGRKLARAYRDVRARLAEINSFLGENIGAIATIQRLGAESERQSKFDGIVEQHRLAQMQSLGVFATVQPIANVLNGFSMGALLAVGGAWVIEGKLTLGVLVAFLGYLRNIYQPIRDLVEKYNTFLSAVVAAERIAALLGEPVEEESVGQVTLPRDSLEIRFENVSFTYPTREEPVLRKVSFAIPRGKSLAVVGATGSGKSTLARLLLRFYEVEQGEVFLGGIPLSAWDRKRLRSYVGIVHQDLYLFQGTLRENLTLGREGLSDGYLVACCQKAQLWPFVYERGGLDMPILEAGTNLSLGERQLLSLTRILVLDSPTLILDEATSSVDPALEAKLMEALAETISGRTALIIAHRLSTVRRADEILVLDKGRVVERGSHSDLLARGEHFARLHAVSLEA